jgi:hypothetical protein
VCLVLHQTFIVITVTIFWNIFYFNFVSVFSFEACFLFISTWFFSIIKSCVARHTLDLVTGLQERMRGCIAVWIVSNWLTARSEVHPEKLIGLQLLMKFPAFYGTRRFITAFTGRTIVRGIVKVVIPNWQEIQRLMCVNEVRYKKYMFLSAAWRHTGGCKIKVIVIVNLCARWWSVVSFTLRLIYPWEGVSVPSW